MNCNHFYLYKILKKLKIKSKYHQELLNKFSNSYHFYERFFGKNYSKFSGGGEEIEIKKEIFIYKDYQFRIRTLRDTEDGRIIIKINSKDFGFCLIMFIDKDINYVQLENLSNFPDCAENKIMPYHGGGKILLIVAINYLKQNFDKYKRNRIVLADNSRIHCFDNHNVSRDIFLAPLTTLKKGHTWYGLFGFRPFSSADNKPDNLGLELYNKNKKIMDNAKLYDNIDIIKMIIDIETKFKYGIISYEKIKKIINKNKDILVKEFIQKLLEIEKICIIFQKIYLKILIELRLHNFKGDTFYLDFM